MKRLLLSLLLLTSTGVNAFDPATQTVPYVVADKLGGKIVVIYPDIDGRLSTPALYGKVISDEVDWSSYDKPGRYNGITPAGTFTLKHYYSTYLKGPMLVFIEGERKMAGLHPTWLGSPREQRPERLGTPTPDDNRITNGCINVPSDFFFRVLNKLPDGTPLYILSEAETLE